MHDDEQVYVLEYRGPEFVKARCTNCQVGGKVLDVYFEMVPRRGGFTQKGLYYTYTYSHVYNEKVKKTILITCPVCKGTGIMDAKNNSMTQVFIPLEL